MMAGACFWLHHSHTFFGGWWLVLVGLDNKHAGTRQRWNTLTLDTLSDFWKKKCSIIAVSVKKETHHYHRFGQPHPPQNTNTKSCKQNKWTSCTRPARVKSNDIMSSSSSSSCFGFKRGFLNTKKPRRSATAAKVPSTSSIQDAPDDECVLCYYPLPRNIEQSTYKSCCGSTICAGCINAQKRVRVIGTNVKLPIAGSKEEKREFIKIICYSLDVCPFVVRAMQ